MVTSKALYCLPVIRQGNRFKTDRESTFAFSDLLDHASLKQLLAENFRAYEGIVEVDGIAHVGRIFESHTGDDCIYALVGSDGAPSAPPSLWQLFGNMIRP
jgi:hypothetical protein